MKKLTFKSPEETKSFARRYANQIPNGKVLALIGNLGAGKTTFSQGFALGLGVDDSQDNHTGSIRKANYQAR